MKIAHVTATFLPYHSGTGVVCYQNALGLATLGHDVEIFTSNFPAGDYTYPDEINVHRLAVALRIGNAPLLPGLLRLRGFDIVHLHYPFVFGQEIIYLLSWLRNIRYVVTYHQDLILTGFKGQAVRMHHKLIGNLVLRRARRLLVTSNDYANAARIAPIVQTRGEKTLDLPNGVDADRFNPHLESSELRAKYGLSETDRVVLFVGGLDTPHYFKGVDVLLRSIQKLNDSSIRLMLVGDGDLRPAYTRTAKALGLDDHVIFCGRVDDELLPQHYALCDILVLPSTTMGEAFGIVLLEAMACGKPVIASNLPGVRSVVTEGEDGLLVRPADADDLAQKITTLLDDPERRQQMGQRGRAKVEAKYTWPQISQRLESIYEGVLADEHQ